MSQSHIASAFDRDLEEIQALLVRMGGLVEVAIHDGSKALVEKDVELADHVRAADKKIDKLEEKINDECARVLALRSPMGSDLRVLLTVIKIASGLERVGDYAKNMAKRTPVIVNAPGLSASEGALRRMAKEVELMLRDVLDAFTQSDVDLADSVRQKDQEVDQMYNAIFRQFITYMMEDPRNISACMHLHFIAKNLERMGDHVTNIAEQVIYMVTGSMPEDPRPKESSTLVWNDVAKD